MNSTKEKVSYCIGLQTGKNLQQQFSDMCFTSLMDGITDALNNTEAKLPNEEIHSILVALKNQIETQQKQFIAKVADENKKRSEAFLAANKEKPEVQTLSSGLQYKVLQKGEEGPSPTPLDAVKIHYRGSFIDGRVFDSSYQRGQPVVFPLNRVIAGWSEALQLMSVGSKWEVYIPSYLAYGEHGFGQEIGPNTALVFEIELLGINVPVEA
ncbi:MAG: FKBP-type peptidyl-prolyl cis-trans isomerase [Rhabdochlamydiaceae bacterium]|nr:FKBP-type peptidyl-prolyl cis-trans isomerase [Rhabdochlamydiaceae bacterium]